MNVAITSVPPPLPPQPTDPGVNRDVDRGTERYVEAGRDAVAERSRNPSGRDTGGVAPGGSGDRNAASSSGAASFDPVRLTDQELARVRELAAIDREVRAHEQAHAAVGGPYAGSPSYTYTRGPDGRQYAIGGEVPIDVSPVAGNPEATINKARIVRRAALAPAQPSGQDRSIAARATAMEQQARIELREEEAEARADRSPRDPSAAMSREEETRTEFDEILRSYRPVDTRA